MSGYSGTPLAKKLGIAAGARRELLAPLAAGVQTVPRIDAHTDVIHVFATRRADLGKMLRTALRAVDETWSGLKLVIRRTRRAAPGKLPRTRAAASRPGSRS